MQGMTKRSGASFSLLVFRPSVEKEIKSKSYLTNWHKLHFYYNCIMGVQGLLTIKRIHIWKGVSMSNTITLSYTNDFKPVNNHIPPAQSLRIHCVSVRFNKEELAILNKNRGDKSKGEWLRLTSLIGFLLSFLLSMLKLGNHSLTYPKSWTAL